MTVDSFSPISVIAAILIASLTLLALVVWRLKSGALSRTKKILWLGIACLALLPLAPILFGFLWFTLANFPFTSGVIAHASSPGGDEACVVQTFKGAEPYQVSLYARRSGQTWKWHYLAHQDNRWVDCRIEFTDRELRVYTGDTPQKTFLITDATSVPDSAHEELPADYTPEQILLRHNQRYRQ